MKKIRTPMLPPEIASLRMGEMVLLTGEIFTARDAAHKKMTELIRQKKEPPFPYEGNAVYYAGPCPAPPGKIIGSIGPTTSGRMDAYAPLLMENGLRIMIGKGQRSQAVKDAIVKVSGVYLAAIGGAGALMARRIKEVSIVAFDELGTEAVRRLLVEDLPLVVAIDAQGRDIYLP